MSGPATGRPTGFDTLLVANRGEIAVRVLRTAAAMGLRTVAVHSDADTGALHTRLADTAVRIGPTPPRSSYLLGERVLEAAAATGAGAVHPGYGFLAEDAGFARAVEAAGLAFVGPRPEHLELFGAKHTARAAAAAAGVPLLAGTDLLEDLAAALTAAEGIGYPVMLKATAGGGGIGMRACADEGALVAAWDDVRRLAGASFGSTGVFLERAVTAPRHVEVQVFGDGLGTVVALGDRDCSLQRRHQKVCEEAPAPDLPDAVRARVAGAAVALCASVAYRSAGTVEYVYDAAREEAAFLEVNTRLQVEHPVTEAVYGVDLVGWMIRLAQGETGVVATPLTPRGHAVEARVYAEDPDRDHAPSPGTVTALVLPTEPDGVRVDTWVEPGAQVSAAYDPLLAKVVTSADDRAGAWAGLARALAGTRVGGVATNLGLLRELPAHPDVVAARHSTATLAGVRDTTPRLVVVRPGTLTAVQDWPGRTGYWHVGVPPSGPMDDLSFRAGNRALGNPEGAAGLECTLQGPALAFPTGAVVLVAGAPAEVTVDGAPAPQWEPVTVPTGAVLEVGAPTAGMRTYLLVRGGLDVLPVLGSAATFDLGDMGGTTGGPLRVGDAVPLGVAPPDAPAPVAVPPGERPEITGTWEVGVLEGPHAAPDFFTVEDVEAFYAATWRVHHNSARTGVRLVGPRPTWARPDGGEAGLHPSNIHDTPYAVGAVDYTGDTPILLGPDGPSLGGFTCPATLAAPQLWKLGQLRPGDAVRFVPVDTGQAAVLRRAPAAAPVATRAPHTDGGVLARTPASPGRPEVTYRRSGEDNLLVEHGPMLLDLASRIRVHALAEALAARTGHGTGPGTGTGTGVLDLTPGIRSLQVHVDPDVLPLEELLALVREVEEALPPSSELVVPSRTVHLPLSWDDPATREAIARYESGVRDDAPWNPWNIEFIRRVNGLGSVDDVHAAVFAAEYLVLGLGDVYLGAPVATPLDPRHRLVTTKYNPARTWTPQNAVGIGGAYLCVYGMEGPGGYQLVGRTVPVWSTHAQRGPFEPGVPWLLRSFDRIRFFPVSAEELTAMRAQLVAGTLALDVEDGVFALADHERWLAEQAAPIAAFRERQAAAFGAERAAWAAAGEFDPRPDAPPPAAGPAGAAVPDGCEGVEAPFAGGVVQVGVAAGDAVAQGQVLLSLEAMKMESRVLAPRDGQVVSVAVAAGATVAAGDVLVVLGGGSGEPA